MNVEVKIDSNLRDEKVVIHAKELTDEIEKIAYDIKRITDHTITGSYDGKIYLMSARDVNYFFAETQRVFAKREDGLKIQVKYKLYEIEELLQNEGFIRISNSVIANINKIDNLEMSFNGVLSIKFLNGDKEYSSRRYVKKIKEYLGL